MKNGSVSQLRMVGGSTVEVVRSAKRRKSVQARFVDGVLRVSIPSWMSRGDEDRWVAEMVARVERGRSTEGVDLVSRAANLASRYDLPLPTSISWVGNQVSRWGSCTPSTGTVRISSRLAGWPVWVIDYVVVHELAHLVEAGHGPRFWAIVARYPLAERARGFLIAKGLDDGDTGPDQSTDPPAPPGQGNSCGERPVDPPMDQPDEGFVE